MASESNSEGRLLTKEHVWKMVKVQNPHLMQTILDCMRKNNNLFHVSGESGSNIQHTRYLDSVFPIRIVPKRNLLQSVAEVPASAPVPVAGSPFFSPVPSADLAPSPVSTPSPVSMPSPVSTPSPQKPFFPQGGDSSPTATEDASAGPASDPNVEPDSHRSNHKVIVIAVVVTAAVTFAFAALFFFFCTKIRRRNSGGRQNDEKPLLSLSLSNYSTGT